MIVKPNIFINRKTVVVPDVLAELKPVTDIVGAQSGKAEPGFDKKTKPGH
jgi:hypothetical protein